MLLDGASNAENDQKIGKGTVCVLCDKSIVLLLRDKVSISFNPAVALQRCVQLPAGLSFFSLRVHHAQYSFSRGWVMGMGSLLLPLAIFTAVALGGYAGIAQAQGVLPGETGDQPKDRSSTITVGVPDVVPPSSPELVLPENGSDHSTLPSFVWTEADDNVGVTAYDFYLDGTVFIANVPIISTTAPTYGLIYDADESLYTLTLTSGGPADGAHTWKVVAKDAANNQGSSVTWTFSLDTTAPTFVIDTIDEEEVTISAQDSDTIPNEPIQLSTNEPELTGHGEANSTVIFRLYKQKNQSDQLDELETEIEDDGTWSIFLSTLPRGTVIYLTVEVTDLIGLTSSIEDIPLLLPEETVEIPVPGSEPIVIPITPPQEILQTTTREVSRTIYDTVSVPLQKITAAVEPILEPVVTPITTAIEEANIVLTASSSHHTKVLSPLWYTHIMALIALLLLPLLKSLILVFRQGLNSTPLLLKEIGMAVGFWPDRRKKCGLLVNVHTLQPIPGVLISYLDPDSHGKQSEVISDEHGFFSGLWAETSSLIKISAGKHELLVPPRQPGVKQMDWLSEQAVEWQRASKEGGFVLPLDCTFQSALSQRILRKPKYPFWAIALAVCITIITPTIGNLLVSLISSLLWVAKEFVKSRSSLQINVYYKTLKKVVPAIVRISHDQNPQLCMVNHHAEAVCSVQGGMVLCQAWDKRWKYSRPAEAHLTKTSPTAEIDLIVDSGGE